MRQVKGLLSIVLISVCVCLQGCGLPVAGVAAIVGALAMGAGTVATYYVEHQPSPTPTPAATPTPAPAAPPTVPAAT